MDDCIAKPAQIDTLQRILGEMMRLSTCREGAEKRSATDAVRAIEGSSSHEAPDKKDDDKEVVPPAAKRAKYAVA